MNTSLILAIALFALSEGFPSFDVHIIDEIGTQLGQTSLVDVDNDGDLDWIAGQASRAGGDIWWWEYVSADEWIRHELGKGDTDVGGAALDVNGDGWVDVVSGSKLLLNPGDPENEPFSEHDIGTIYSHDTEFADVNGDGRMDLVANSDESGLYWYQAPDDLTQPWTEHLVISADEHKIHGGPSPHPAGDFDGDGDADILTGEAWYENADGAGTEWIQHKTIDFGERHRYGLAVRSWILDLNSDGDLDFIQSEADNPDARVAWFENDGKGSFTRHIIKDKGDGKDFHSLAVADFDLDGDMDVYAGGGPLSASGSPTGYIWENAGGDEWIEHVVLDLPCHEAEAADVDGDGDIDICTKPWRNGARHIFLENKLR